MDQRLVRDGFIENRSAEALALYLFLITVCDSHGLSYYSDSTICRMLGFSSEILKRVRSELAYAELIAYEQPFYQVLSLTCKPTKVTMSMKNSRNSRLNDTEEIISRLMAQIENKQ